MYHTPRINYVRPSLPKNDQKPLTQVYTLTPKARIKQQLEAVGASRTARYSQEAAYLPHIIHDDEYIQGVVFGKAENGMAMLIATDKRAIFLDKKPMFVIADEITYDVVSGVSHGNVGFGSTVTLHTRVKDYKIKTVNERSAQIFVSAIEASCVEHARSQIWSP